MHGTLLAFYWCWSVSRGSIQNSWELFICLASNFRGNKVKIPDSCEGLIQVLMIILWLKYWLNKGGVQSKKKTQGGKSTSGRKGPVKKHVNCLKSQELLQQLKTVYTFLFTDAIITYCWQYCVYGRKAGNGNKLLQKYNI